LTVGSLNAAVDVAEAPALIDTATSQAQATYGADLARDRPTAGVSKLVNGAGIYNISLNGAGENNTFAIDGVNNDFRQ
jgi:hypothetical protein